MMYKLGIYTIPYRHKKPSLIILNKMMSNKVFICIICFFIMGIVYAAAQMIFVGIYELA